MNESRELKNITNDFGMRVQVKQNVHSMTLYICVKDGDAETRTVIQRELARYQDSIIANMEQQLLDLRRKKAEQRDV